MSLQINTQPVENLSLEPSNFNCLTIKGAFDDINGYCHYTGRVTARYFTGSPAFDCNGTLLAQGGTIEMTSRGGYYGTYSAGSIIMNACDTDEVGVGFGGNAGSINTSGSQGGNGGSINTCSGFYSSGGSVNTTGGNGSCECNPSGGDINTSGGDHPGGGINTSNGGGSIVTNGTGCIGLGSASGYIQTMLCGTASNYNQTLCFPDTAGVNGVIALQGCFPNDGLTSKIFRGINHCTGTGGCIDITPYYAGECMNVGNGGCFISKGGCGYGSGCGGSGGIVNTSGGEANEGSGGNGGNGGTLSLGGGLGTLCYDGSSYCIINGGSGGGIISNGGSYYNYSADGGTLNMSAGFDVNGGSINTSNGGGSINTTGSGYIQFGNDTTRTILNGTATENRNINLPNFDGTLVIATTGIKLGDLVEASSVSGTLSTFQLTNLEGTILGYIPVYPIVS
jgi:hypothetical protein